MVSSFAPPRALGAAGVPPSQAMAARLPPLPPLRGTRPTPAPRMLLAGGSGTGGAPLVAPLVALLVAPFSAPLGTAPPGANPRSSRSAHLLGTRAGNLLGKLASESFGHISCGTQSSEQPGHTPRKDATASLRAADTTATSADAASCTPVAVSADPDSVAAAVVAAEAAPEAAYSAPLLGTNGTEVFAFRVGCIAVGRARHRMSRCPAHRPFGGNFEVITFLPHGLAVRSCTVNWLAACSHSSRMFPCFRVYPRSRLVRARQRKQRR